MGNANSALPTPTFLNLSFRLLTCVLVEPQEHETCS